MLTPRMEYLAKPKNRDNRYDLYSIDHPELSGVIIPRSIKSLSTCAKYLKNTHHIQQQTDNNCNDLAGENRSCSINSQDVVEIRSFSPISKVNVKRSHRNRLHSKRISTKSISNNCARKHMQAYVELELDKFDKRLSKLYV